MSKDTVLELRRLADKMAGTTAVIVFNSTLRDAADEIELLRSTVTDCRIEIERLIAERDEARRELDRLRAELAKYKRMYCRMACRDLYASGVKWKTKPNKMRTDGVFIEEDCEPGKNRTWAAFPIQFAHDDAAQIVELLNRAADELAREAK